VHLHHILRQLFPCQRRLLLGDGAPNCYVLVVSGWPIHGQISKWVCFSCRCLCAPMLPLGLQLMRATDVELPPAQQKPVPKIDEERVTAMAQTACVYINKAMSL
jgi:hypothetical protein